MRMRGAVALACVASVGPAGTARGGELNTVPVATIDFPVFVTYAPGDAGRLFVLGRNGRISIIKDGQVLPEPFLDLTAVVDTTGFEQGLLGLAFHPDYDKNGFFYVNYTYDDLALIPDQTVVARYQVGPDPDVADPASAQVVLKVIQPHPGHNAGWMGFGPGDQYLYIALGDGGGGVDEDDDAQSLDSLLGKILRIDVDCDQFPADDETNYGIPPDNPFVGTFGRDEIWAYGLRNPWRCSFDRATGDLYIGDVGAAGWEEVNRQPAGSGGLNFGWDCMEALECTGEATCACADAGLTDPVFAYAHTGSAAVIGGYVYRGSAIPWLAGALLFGDHYGRFWTLRHDGGRITELIERQAELDPGPGSAIDRPVSLGEDIGGELYICDRIDSEIFKVVSACPLDVDGSGDVAVNDLLALLGAWGTDPGGPPDFDGSGDVGVADLLALLGAWGPCP